MYTAEDRSESHLGQFGLSADDYGDEDDAYEVWPCCWESFRIFSAMGTQWRVAVGGATGLDYGVLPAVMRFEDVPGDRRTGVYNDLRVMESEVLTLFSERRQEGG